MAAVSPANGKSERFAVGALSAGVAALVIFGIAPFTSDALWPIGLVLAGIAVVVGWFALRQTTRGERSRALAIGALVASGIVIAWFLVYLVVSAVD